MSRFVGDAQDFRRPDESPVLVITEDLLEELSVSKSARVEQERAVKQWLADNEPNKVLARSLREDGFVATNVSNNLSNEPRRTGPDDTGRPDLDPGADLHQRGRKRTTPDRRHPNSGGS